ncbi:sensor histidine kinase [Cyclobacterium qasimii]|nr:7TM diverse intracellular signaling domain-containing protein [Cyclobacterium qasimii]
MNIITIKSPVMVKQIFQFSDANALYSLPDILALPKAEWKEVSAINFDKNSGSGWVYIKVKSNTTQPLLMELQTPFIDTLKIWLIDNAGKIHEFPSTGFSHLSKANYNPLKHRYFLTELPIKNYQTFDVIIHGNNSAGYPMKYFVKFWNQPEFIHYSNESNWRWALFIGMILTVIFVSLAAYFIQQKRIYYYFAAYITCFSLYALLIDGWGIYLAPSLYKYYNPIQNPHLLNLGICFFLLFSRKFLVIPSLSPKWWLRISPWWFFAALAGCIFLTNYGYINSNDILYKTGYWFGILMLISITVLWGSCLRDSFQRKFQPVWLLLASQAFVIIFLVANIILVNLNAVYLTVPDILLLRIALTAQVLLISIGWIFRQKEIRDTQDKQTLLYLEQQKAFWDAERELQELKISSLRISNELHVQREHLARDLHDGIGSQLTHIISRLDILSISDNSQQKQLKQLRDFTRDINQNLRETIWILNKKEVTCSQFALRLHGYLQNLWEGQQYPQLTWHCSNPSENIILSPEVAVHLMRLTQEAIANIIKHAQADEIVVELRINPPQLNLVIKDNGIGFDPEKSSYGFGLENMRKRAAEMGGGMDLKSGNSGTEIQVIIPVTT